MVDVPTADDDTVEVVLGSTTGLANPHLVNSRVAVAGAALSRALGAAGTRVLERNKSFAAVITVPSAQWTDTMQSCVRQLGHPSVTFTTGSDKPKSRDAEGIAVSLALARGGSVVGVSHSPSTLLPQVLLTAATHNFVVPPVDINILAEAMKRCMVGRAPASLRQLSLAGMDFDTVCACLPRGAHKAEGVDRLRRASESSLSPATSTTLTLPLLEDAVEYGQAREWGLDLKQDIADLRARKISWRDVDRGAILEGPPGSGKTTFAKILGQSCGLPTVIGSVSELFASTAGHLDSVIKAQRKLFEEAASKAPCILFLDEINALPDPATMSPRGRDWWLPVIYDFYLLLDSAVSARDGIIVVGATNMIKDISPALLRPGRLERAIHIGIPTVDGLVNILRTHLADELTREDLRPLAKAGEGATAAVAMDWVRSARRASRRAGRTMITLADLAAQISPADTRATSERYRCAVHEAGHGVIGYVLGEPLIEISITRKGNSGGRTSFVEVDGALFDRPWIENKVKMILGGMAAEMGVLSSVSSGGGGGDGSDLAKATELLAATRTSFGMTGDLLWRGAPETAMSLLERDPALRSAVESDLQRLYSETRTLVDQHHAHILSVTARLMEAGTVSAQHVREVIDGRPIQRRRVTANVR